MLSEGMAGFLITCNMREREAVQESYNLFNEYADKIVGPEIRKDVTDREVKGNVKDDEKDDNKDKDNAEEESDDDIDAAMDKEKEQILKVANTAREERRFNRIDSGAKNCIFIKTTLQDPCEIVSHIIEDASVHKKQKSRYILRLIPVIGTCKSHDKNITELMQTKLEQIMKIGEEISYCIIYKCRNNNQVKQHEILELINEAVHKFNPSAKIELKTPQVCIYVEIIRNVFCLGVARDFFKHKKYNLQEMIKEDDQKEDDHKEDDHKKDDPKEDDHKEDDQKEVDHNQVKTEDKPSAETDNKDVPTDSIVADVIKEIEESNSKIDQEDSNDATVASNNIVKKATFVPDTKDEVKTSITE